MRLVNSYHMCKYGTLAGQLALITDRSVDGPCSMTSD